MFLFNNIGIGKTLAHFATILTYNINTFKANFHNFLALFDNFEEFPDILVLTETIF